MNRRSCPSTLSLLVSVFLVFAFAHEMRAATITVQSDQDDGTSNAANCPGPECRLRDAVAAAAAGDTIDFAGDFTIGLVGRLLIARDLTISGTDHSVTLSGRNANGVILFAGSEGALNLIRLNIANGYSGSGGGGIVLLGNLLNVYECTFVNNSSRTRGGAIEDMSLPSGGVYVSGSTFIGNLARGRNGGGAIYSFHSMVVNCTFSGNHAANGGGAITARGTVTNSTFVGNSADDGGAIYQIGALTVVNSVVAGNSGGNCVATPSSPPISGSGNLSDDDSCGASFTVTTSALLGPLGDYGGLTQTVPLLPGSAAIGAASTNCPTTDQRGVARSSPVCDAGAFESGGFALTIAGGNHQSTPVNTPFANPLAITVAPLNPGEPVDGGYLSFLGPASGASTNPPTNTATIAGGGVAQTVTANAVAGGPYDVVSSANGTDAVAFTLTNTLFTTTTITSSPNPSSFGQAATFTATVSPSPFGGTLTFRNGGSDIGGCSGGSISGGVSSCTTSTLAAGSHDITAIYSGDGIHLGSTATTSHTVNPALTSLAIDAPSIVYGNGATVTVTLSTAAAAPAGNIELTVDGGAPLTAPLVTGVATFTLPSPAAGDHPLVATFAGDANHASSIANATLRVDAAATSLAIDAPSIVYGNSATVTVTLTTAAATPSGNIALTVDAGAPLTAPLVAGVATFTVPSLAAGDHPLVATFAGDANYPASNATATLHVDAAPTSVAISAPAIVYGDPASVTVTITTAAPLPAGDISLSVDGEAPIVSALAGGVGTFSLPSLAGGEHSLVAVFAGDTNYLSCNASATLFVGPAAPAITSPASGSTVGATLLVVTGTATPGVTITLFVDGAASGTATAGPGGTWTITLAGPLSQGAHTLTATATDALSNTTSAASPAVVVNVPAAAAVPTLSTLALLLLGVGMAIAGSVALGRMQ
ncbi:MAG: Ig-like domain repeat protein [Thermoanaerobaculia bacterium]